MALPIKSQKYLEPPITSRRAVHRWRHFTSTAAAFPTKRAGCKGKYLFGNACGGARRGVAGARRGEARRGAGGRPPRRSEPARARAVLCSPKRPWGKDGARARWCRQRRRPRRDDLGWRLPLRAVPSQGQLLWPSHGKWRRRRPLASTAPHRAARLHCLSPRPRARASRPARRGAAEGRGRLATGRRRTKHCEASRIYATQALRRCQGEDDSK